MTTKSIILTIIGIILIGGGIWLYGTWRAYAPTTYVDTNGTTVNTTTGKTSTTTPTYTLAEVAAHNTEASCFTAIQNKVYDLTLWINVHPGGSKPILSICGIDGTEKFMKKHKGEKKFMDILNTRFYVGNLK